MERDPYEGWKRKAARRIAKAKEALGGVLGEPGGKVWDMGCGGPKPGNICVTKEAYPPQRYIATTVHQDAANGVTSIMANGRRFWPEDKIQAAWENRGDGMEWEHFKKELES